MTREETMALEPGTMLASGAVKARVVKTMADAVALHLLGRDLVAYQTQWRGRDDMADWCVAGQLTEQKEEPR